jgi:hypothetical protein
MHGWRRSARAGMWVSRQNIATNTDGLVIGLPETIHMEEQNIEIQVLLQPERRALIAWCS